MTLQTARRDVPMVDNPGILNADPEDLELRMQAFHLKDEIRILNMFLMNVFNDVAVEEKIR